MEKTKIENKVTSPKTRIKYKARARKAATWIFMGIGSVALITSVIYVSSILAFIGLGLVFWAALFLYIQPEEYTKKAILDAIVIPSLDTLNKLIQEIDYKGKGIYLPPKYLQDPEANKVYISKQKDGKLPKPELTLKHENQLFIENPQGILLTPPGDQLSRIFEKQLDTVFAKTDLNYLTQNLPNLLIQDLEIAENIEIETENNKIKIKITNSIFKETHKEKTKIAHIHPSISCPLSSAIACALTKATGNPIAIENIQTSEDGKIIESTYRILGKTESKTLLPEIKPEEISEELPRELIPYPLGKRLLPNLTSLLLTIIGSILLTEVAWITLYDMTTWGKDIATIFLGSRTGQAISLGIGMKIIYYFILGLASFLSGILTYLRRRIKV